MDILVHTFIALCLNSSFFIHIHVPLFSMYSLKHIECCCIHEKIIIHLLLSKCLYIMFTFLVKQSIESLHPF